MVKIANAGGSANQVEDRGTRQSTSGTRPATFMEVAQQGPNNPTINIRVHPTIDIRGEADH